MSVDALLARLQKVKSTGHERWIACCPAHEDTHPSLSVAMSTRNPGHVLLRCFSGCAVENIVAAVGLELDALFPDRPASHRGKGERRPFFPSDVFQIVLHEVTIVSVLACDMHANREIPERDYERLLTACGRLNNIAEAAYGK